MGMDIGLIIVGDEILSGRRTDRHLGEVAKMLANRGLSLSWAKVLGDEPAALEQCYRDSFASGDLVLSTGGIGATPDDLTREAVAAALDTVTERHPEGTALLEKYAREKGRELTPERYRLVEFPRGSELIPNPYNGIPGFRIQHHHFVPGFPQMAWPMIEWVLDTLYPDLGDSNYREYSVMLESANESRIIPMMEQILKDFPDVKVFSLPIIDEPPRIELGVKGLQAEARAAMDSLKSQLNAAQVSWKRH
jgi:molybdopterin-biosynthesis enzyme MoeA-like protein